MPSLVGEAPSLPAAMADGGWRPAAQRRGPIIPEKWGDTPVPSCRERRARPGQDQVRAGSRPDPCWSGAAESRPTLGRFPSSSPASPGSRHGPGTGIGTGAGTGTGTGAALFQRIVKRHSLSKHIALVRKATLRFSSRQSLQGPLMQSMEPMQSRMGNASARG